MSEPALLSYIGAISGMIGAIAGVAGAIMGFISYRRSTQLKSLDMRIELRKTGLELFEDIHDLYYLLEDAKKSRLAVSSATGKRNSGAMERWLKQHEADLSSLQSLDQGLNELNIDFSKCSHNELESWLVEAHGIKSIATRLREKYTADRAADDRERDHIRQDIRARMQPRQENTL